MPTGEFTQSAMVLLDSAIAPEAIERQLEEFGPVGCLDRDTHPTWIAGNPGLLIRPRPEADGYLLVDVLDRPWPDEMAGGEGDILPAAREMGIFGPLVFPGSLGRAVAHAYNWQDASAVAQYHKAFVRIRCSYNLEGSAEAAVPPADYDPGVELLRMSCLAQALLSLPEALCYFNPNGETIHTARSMAEAMRHHEAHQRLPLKLWSNIRLFNLDEDGDWLVIDTVGMEQLGVVDHEAIFPAKSYDLARVVHFLRNVRTHICQRDLVMREGITLEGPGSVRWRARSVVRSFAEPKRRVFRWLPKDGSRPPQCLLG